MTSPDAFSHDALRDLTEEETELISGGAGQPEIVRGPPPQFPEWPELFGDSY